VRLFPDQQPPETFFISYRYSDHFSSPVIIITFLLHQQIIQSFASPQTAGSVGSFAAFDTFATFETFVTSYP
jgi:hypothetical protein